MNELKTNLFPIICVLCATYLMSQGSQGGIALLVLAVVMASYGKN